MTTLDSFLEAEKEEFKKMFYWADQIKESEYMRWKMMYGFTPMDLVEERTAHDSRLLAQVREMVAETTPKWSGIGNETHIKAEELGYSQAKIDILTLLTPPTKV